MALAASSIHKAAATEYCRGGAERREREVRPEPVFNWKAYWGENSSAKLIHFHGPKPKQYDEDGNEVEEEEEEPEEPGPVAEFMLPIGEDVLPGVPEDADAPPAPWVVREYKVRVVTLSNMDDLMPHVPCSDRAARG